MTNLKFKRIMAIALVFTLILTCSAPLLASSSSSAAGNPAWEDTYLIEDTNLSRELSLFAEELSLAIEEFSSIDDILDISIYNFTDKSDAELISARHEIFAQVNSMQAMVEEEINYVLNNPEANPEGLPVTVEIVAIGEDITYIYEVSGIATDINLRSQRGVEINLFLVESNVRYISDLEYYNYHHSIDEVITAEYNTLLSNLWSSCCLECYDHSIYETAMNENIAPLSRTACTRDTRCVRDSNLPSGIGVRLPITRANSNRLSFSVVTSTGANTINPRNRAGTLMGLNYLYGGFSGRAENGNSVISDMGLVHQRLANGSRYAWRPYFRVVHGRYVFTNPRHVDPNGNPGPVQANNGFRLGSTVAIEVRIDPAPNNIYSRVLLRTEGFTYHQNSSGTGGQGYFIQLTFVDMPRIPNLTNWRVLATVAVSGGHSENNIHRALVSGTFNNIRLNGALPTFGTPERDFGFAVNHGNGNWFLQSCKMMP